MRDFILIIFVSLMVFGCAPKKQGSTVTEYAPDGKTILSITQTLNDQEVADVAREKTRQVCYGADNARKSKVQEENKDNKLVLVLLAQTEALTNAMSLLATGKNYDPCPSSTNTQDAAIASSRVWETFWDKSFSFGKVVVAAWGAVEIFDSMFAATAGAVSSYSFKNSGDGNINLTDSLNTTKFGNLDGTFGDWFSRSPVTTTTETQNGQI